MTQKQYADMTTIMQFCRIFSDQMLKCLEGTGLLEQGFYIDLGVNRAYDLETGILACDITLSKHINEDSSNVEDWRATRMHQMRMRNGEWKVYDDPEAKAGSLPPEIRIRHERVVTEGTRKAASKPYPSDGFWVGSDYGSTDVDGGQ